MNNPDKRNTLNDEKLNEELLDVQQRICNKTLSFFITWIFLAIVIGLIVFLMFYGIYYISKDKQDVSHGTSELSVMDIDSQKIILPNIIESKPKNIIAKPIERVTKEIDLVQFKDLNSDDIFKSNMLFYIKIAEKTVNEIVGVQSLAKEIEFIKDSYGERFIAKDSKPEIFPDNKEVEFIPSENLTKKQMSLVFRSESIVSFEDLNVGDCFSGERGGLVYIKINIEPFFDGYKNLNINSLGIDNSKHFTSNQEKVMFLGHNDLKNKTFGKELKFSHIPIDSYFIYQNYQSIFLRKLNFKNPSTLRTINSKDIRNGEGFNIYIEPDSITYFICCQK